MLKYIKSLKKRFDDLDETISPLLEDADRNQLLNYHNIFKDITRLLDNLLDI